MTQDYKDICYQILNRIKGINREDLTTAEQQIADILIDAKLAFTNENGSLTKTDPDCFSSGFMVFCSCQSSTL